MTAQSSAFPDDAGSGNSYDPGSCFCEGDSSPLPPLDLDSGGGFDDAAGFDAGLPPCPVEMPEAGTACPDNRFDECTYLIPHGRSGTCHAHCRCVVIPEEESWSCVPDLDCDP